MLSSTSVSLHLPHNNGSAFLPKKVAESKIQWLPPGGRNVKVGITSPPSLISSAFLRFYVYNTVISYQQSRINIFWSGRHLRSRAKFPPAHALQLPSRNSCCTGDALCSHSKAIHGAPETGPLTCQVSSRLKLAAKAHSLKNKLTRTRKTEKWLTVWAPRRVCRARVFYRKLGDCSRFKRCSCCLNKQRKLNVLAELTLYFNTCLNWTTASCIGTIFGLLDAKTKR